MKVAKWKVLSIAGALVLGYAASAKAVKVFEAGEDQFLELGVEVEAWYEKSGDSSKIDKDVSIGLEGQINEYIQFAADVDPDGDATITFAPIPQFQNQIQITAGKTGIPFANTGSFIPVGSTIYTVDEDVCDESYGLIMFHGDSIANGMLNYKITFFKDENAKDFSFALRFDISPLSIMGSPPEGTNVNIGFGYVSLKKQTTKEELVVKDNKVFTQETLSEKEVSGWAIDGMVEINLADRGMPFVPKIKGGYISLDRVEKDVTNQESDKSEGQESTSSIVYFQVQVLYDEVIGIGKPAFAVEIEKFSEETYFLGAFNYYIGKNLKVSIGGKGGGDTTQFYVFSQVKF